MIAYVVSQYPAPSHTFIRREVAALRAHGVCVETYSVRPAVSLSPDDEAERTRTFCLQDQRAHTFMVALASSFARRPRRWLSTLTQTLRVRPRGVMPLLKAGAHFIEAMRLAAELERAGATHVHCHFANAGSRIGLAASRYLRIGWSVSLHGLSDFGGPGTELLREQIRASSFVASATQYGLAQAMRLSDPTDWHKLHVVRCGVDFDSLPARHRPREPGRLRLLSVGRLAPEKGQRGLLIAVAALVASGIDVELTVVGGGPEEANLRTWAGDMGLGDRLRLLGALPERTVLDVMARCDVFVLSSLAEGLPVVLMEALALEVPVVAPAIHGIPELVKDGRTGLLYTVGRWDELTECMRTLCEDAALRERLGAAGRQRVLADFDAKRSALPLASLFRNQGIVAQGRTQHEDGFEAT